MSHTLSIRELEKRMRPGAYSLKGFLGKEESLESVIAQDSQTLEMLGITHEQIADELDEVLQCAEDQRDELFRDNFPEYRRREGEGRIPNLYYPDPIPRSTLDNLPSTDVGYLVGSRLQVFVVQYRGMQQCPWECEIDQRNSRDFLVLNRQLGEFVTAPGLIVHLIRKHHFFEGLQSPYRVDPAALARVLGLASKLGTTEQDMAP